LSFRVRKCEGDQGFALNWYSVGLAWKLHDISVGDRHQNSGGYDMKRKLLLCVSALVLAIASAFAPADSAPSATPVTEKAVAARSSALAIAAVNGDVASFRAFMSDDYVML
jgi:hypothetical protein